MNRLDRFFLCLAALLTAVALPPVAHAAELPPGVVEMLREAYPKERKTVINVVKRRYPDSVDEVDRLVKSIDAEKRAVVTKADFFSGIRGEAVAGGFVSTGNTDEWGLSGSVSLRRRASDWVHYLELRADIKEEDKERTEERLFANYSLRRNFTGSDWFVIGGVRYERDPFQGLASRFGQFVGPGYQIIDKDDLKWEVMAGPGFRQTNYIDAPNEKQFGLFARTTFTSNLTDTLQFKQDMSAGMGKGNDTYVSITSLTSDFYGDLALRASFTAELETDPPPGREKLDTYTRMSIVYTFE